MRLTHEDLMECVQALGVFTSVLALLAPSPTRAQIGKQGQSLEKNQVKRVRLTFSQLF